MKEGTSIYGFTVTRVREVREQEATLIEMTHDKTGAKLCWMKSGEENKLFSIAFQTLPEDDTGVFHILEHSVLCGSEKYPVKEPFVELLKGSMNTFLNAMTFADKTMYPVSSRNKTDFLNLTKVYLDAVFAPKILTDKNIFYQEGWHVELNEGEEPAYKGVVFNEMKGAMSSIDEVMELGMARLLFPDNCYGFESGGDPEHIPELTYDAFVAAYRKYYHPTNAYIWLDGNIPLDETLPLIDEYLSRFERSDAVVTIARQKPIPASEATVLYEIAEDEDEKDKAQLSVGKVVATWAQREKGLAIEILCDVLTGTNESPIKRALLTAGLCQDVVMRYTDNIFQPAVSLWVKNINDDRRGEVLSVIRETAQSLYDNGLDKRGIESNLNRIAFRTREPMEPQGLIRNIYATSSWMYGGDPLQYLCHDEVFLSLREKLNTRYFEELMAEILLEPKGQAILRALPSKTLGAQRRAEEAAKLRAQRNAWSPEDERAHLQMNKALTDWQQTPDSPENLAKLPALSLSDVNPLPEKIETDVKCINGVTVLTHKANCKGITHLSLYFALTDFDLSALPALSLLKELLGTLPTKRLSAVELEQEIKLNLGRLAFSVETHANPEDTKTCTPCLVANASVLTEKLPAAEKLIYEILTETRFDEKERIREIVLQTNETMKQTLMMMGHAAAISGVLAHYSAEGAANEATGGYTRLTWLSAFAKDFDGRYDEFCGLMRRVQTETVCRSRLTLSVTGAEKIDVASLIADFASGTPVSKDAIFAREAPAKEGVRIPAQVSFAGMGYHLSQCGMAFTGEGRVLCNIVSYSMLWNKVRVQGGAYGAGMLLKTDGSVAMYSFRDPTSARTLSVYRALSDDVNAFIADDEPIDKFIISTIAESEPLKSPRELGKMADTWYFAGMDWEKRCRIRREMLETTKEKLIPWANMLKKMASEGAICVVGHTEALAACEGEGLTVREI